MSDDLTRRAERIIVDCKIEGYCGPCVVIYDLLARLRQEQAEIARLRAALEETNQPPELAAARKALAGDGDPTR